MNTRHSEKYCTEKYASMPEKKVCDALKRLKAMGMTGAPPKSASKSSEKVTGLKRKSCLLDGTKNIGANNFTKGYVSNEKPKRNHLTILSTQWQDTDSPKRPAKMRKIEHSIRKDLFQSKPKITATSPNSILAKTLDCIDEIDTPEDEIDPGSKKIKKTAPSYTKMQSPRIKKTPKRTQNKTPNTSIDNEFMELERGTVDTSSPLSSMCDLMKSTGLNSPKHLKFETDDKLENGLRMIEHIMELDNIEFIKYKKIREEYRETINNILKDLRKNTSKTDNKENIQRRVSSRLLMKSPVLISQKANIVVSPLLGPKTNDLRKSMFARNLTKSIQQLGTSATKEQKAQEMYKSFKNDCSILCTPKVSPNNKNDIEKSYSLSKKVHNQCLMLQETPKH